MPIVDRRCVLTTGPPWGFRVYLDTNNALTISKIRRNSPADVAKLRTGDHIISLNGRLTSCMNHAEAINFIDTTVGTLDVQITRFESTSTQILIFDKVDSAINDDVKTEMNMNLIRTERTPDEVKVSELERSLSKELTPCETLVRPSSPDVHPISINKLIREYNISDDFNENVPKKKHFADSSFYNDPNHLYPTAEEIIEMARRVAASLYAPDNKSSKGAGIFERQRKRADKYTLQKEEISVNSFLTEEPKYDMAHLPEVVEHKEPSPTPIYRLGYSSGPVIPPPPPPPPVPNEAKTIQEFMEKIQRFPKAKHNVVSPDVCFDIAAALHSSDSRGAQIFAKQKHRAQKWTLTAPEAVTPQPVFATMPGQPPIFKQSIFTNKELKPNTMAISSRNQNQIHVKEQTNENENIGTSSRKAGIVICRNSNQAATDSQKSGNILSVSNSSNVATSTLSADVSPSVTPAAKWKPVKFNVPQRA